MAHTKATGTTKLGRDSESKRLGIKLYTGQKAIAGNIIVRQRGSAFIPGKGTRKGSDDTIYAVSRGVVGFTTKRKTTFVGKTRSIKIVSVL